MEMTNGHRAAWSRLQKISCAHALELAQLSPSKMGGCAKLNRKQISVPEPIRENVEILGRGTEEEVKYRNHWYMTFHPNIFRQVSGN